MFLLLYVIWQFSEAVFEAPELLSSQTGTRHKTSTNQASTQRMLLVQVLPEPYIRSDRCEANGLPKFDEIARGALKARWIMEGLESYWLETGDPSHLRLQHRASA